MTPFQTIVAMVMAQTGLRWDQIIGRSRKRNLVRARWAICWAGWKTTGFSVNEVGKKLNYCDHATAQHAIRRAQELRATDPAFKAFTNRLVAAVPDKKVPE